MSSVGNSGGGGSVGPATAAAVLTPDSESAGGGSVPKWVYALAIGVPLSAALLYVLFGPDDGDKKNSEQKKGKLSM